MSNMLTQAAVARWHGCAVLRSSEQEWEALSGFLEDGLRRDRQIVLAGLRLDQQEGLLRRLSENGVETETALGDGRITLMPEDVSRQFMTLSPETFSQMVADRVGQATAAGYSGLAMAGIYPEVGIGPYESVLDDLVRSVPLDVLCGYDRTGLTFDEVDMIRDLHMGEVSDGAEYDDGILRITRPRAGWVRLAGRWERRNHDAAFAVVADAAAAGHRNVDTSSLRYVDPVGLHALLTGIGGGLRLQRPNHLVQRLAGLLAHKPVGQPATESDDRPSAVGPRTPGDDSDR